MKIIYFSQKISKFFFQTILYLNQNLTFRNVLISSNETNDNTMQNQNQNNFSHNDLKSKIPVFGKSPTISNINKLNFDQETKFINKATSNLSNNPTTNKEILKQKSKLYK